MKILVIDNEKSFAESFGQYLKSTANAEITLANTVKQALNLINQNCYDLIITEVSLPDAENENWLMKIDNINPGQKLIILTSHLFPCNLSLSEKLNIIGYFEKPFDANIILNLINQLTN
ncbi:MAG TPA: response regulator [bacterium]|nr:response regulator [bacterium]